MDIFLLMTGICLLSVFIAWRYDAPLVAPFVSICCTSLIHCAGAMAHIYVQSKMAMLGISVLLGGYTACKLFCSDRERLIRICKPILLFALLLAFFAWHYAQARISYWDEFFWAGFVKHLVLENGLWNWDSILPRKDSVLLYPPGITIIQSLFQPFWHFEESSIALGESALIIAACGVVLHVAMPLIKGTLAKSCLVLSSFVILRALGTLVKNKSYRFAYGDAIQLAVYSSLILMSVFRFMEIKDRLLIWSCCLIFLVLCKATGVVLACFVIGLICINQLIQHDKNEKINKIILKNNFLSTIKTFFILFISCIIVWISWEIYVRYIVFGDMYACFSNIGNYLQISGIYTILKSYINAFFVKTLFSVPYIWYGKYISTTFFFFLAIGAMFYYVHQYNNLNIIKYIQLAYLSLTWFVWLVLHAYVSLRYFTPAEQARAASYERYIAVVIGPALLMALILFLQAVSLQSSLRIKKFFQLCLVFLAVPVVILACMRPNSLPDSIEEMRAAAMCLQESVPSGSTYLIVTGRKEYALNNACQFYVMPDLREAYVEQGISFHPHTDRMINVSLGEFPENFKVFVKKYNVDYLLLWNFDNNFVTRFGRELGLPIDCQAPVLLALQDWQECKTEYPQQIEIK